ncbi:polysaccharide deacetylase family protein [Candidatus Clostridium radicumherbarum]|uniref:Polysaccharide deacetylase family protein n=1 Tax=Candidatus Clostridium radicumherbarum TaxID=3381662 RepID=A0ABW8TWY4_9CLOT
MINLVIDKNLKDKRKIIYTFYYLVENIFDEVQVSYDFIEDAINIYYGANIQARNGIIIPVLKESEPKRLYLHNYEEDTFASFEEKCEIPFIKKDNVIFFNYDIFLSSIYFISCEEEYVCMKRDRINRFLAEFSEKKDSIKTPFFDINSAILYKALIKLNPNLTLKRNGFEIYLTHDIDNADSRNRYVFLHNFKNLISKKNKPFFMKFTTLLQECLFNRYKNILKYMELESSYGAKSEFYFIQGKKHRYGSRYKLSKVRSELEKIKESKDFIIGLHTNFFSYDDKDKIREEINAIEKYADVKILSCRNHYLRFKVPETWDILKNSGLKFDTTLGYADSNGFRAGTTKAFLPYNLKNNEVINIYEIPLSIMDVSIMEKPMTSEEKWNEIKYIIDQVKRNRGTSSVLWHEDVYNYRNYRDVYEKMLNYIKANEGEFVNYKDLENRLKKQKEELYRLFNSVE